MIVFGMGSIEKSDEEVIEALNVVESKRYTYALLETPVGEEKVIFSDLVIKSFEEEDYTELENFFSDEFSDTQLYWYMGIYDYYDQSRAKKVISRKDWQAIRGSGSKVQEIVIPSYYGEQILLKIRIVEGMEIVPDPYDYGYVM